MLAAAPFAYGPGYGYGAYGPAAFGGYGGYGLGYFNQQHPQQGHPGLGLQNLASADQNHCYSKCVDMLTSVHQNTAENDSKCMSTCGVLPSVNMWKYVDAKHFAEFLHYAKTAACLALAASHANVPLAAHCVAEGMVVSAAMKAYLKVTGRELMNLEGHVY